MQAAYYIASPPGGARPLKSIALRANFLLFVRSLRGGTPSPSATTIGGKLGGFGNGRRAPTPAVGGSSLPFVRSAKPPKTGMEKLQVLELSTDTGGSSSMDGAFNGKFSASGSYHSSGHGAHSHIESIDTASGSEFSASHSRIASRNASMESKSSGSGGSSVVSGSRKFSCPVASAL